MRIIKEALATVAIIVTGLASNAAAQEAYIGVASVVDGDTLAMHGKRLRLHRIDAPEAEQTCYEDGVPWRCGQRAAMALADKIARRTLQCTQTGGVSYSRPVVTCTLGDEDINQWMVSSGWALEWARYSGGRYQVSQTMAKDYLRGIWGSKFEYPWDWRHRRASGRAQ